MANNQRQFYAGETPGERFDPRKHLMQIKNKGGSNDYLPVQWRLVWFREECPQGTIETEIVTLDLDRETEEETFAWNSETRRSEKVVKRAPGYAVVKAVVKDGNGGMATGYKSEKAASFGDFLEKAETGAIGRALAALGYGTQFTDDLEEGKRIVDSPVDQNVSAPQATNAAFRPQQARTNQPASRQEQPAKHAEQKPAQSSLPISASAPTTVQPNAERPYLPYYNVGREKGLWSDFSGFCTFATTELGEEVNRDNVRSLKPEQLARLDIAIKEEEPVKKAS